MTESEPQVPPGWYPTGDGWQRYWDGVTWTEHLAPTHASVGAPGHPAALHDVTSDDRTIAALTHLGGALLTFLVPLIVYLIKKDESPFLRHHAAESMNFHITTFIFAIVSAVLLLVVIGFFLLIALFFYFWILTILATVAAGRGDPYHYPLTFRIFT